MSWMGLSLIGAGRGEPGGPTFTGWNPAEGVALEPRFHGARPQEVERACVLAEQAAPTLAALPSRQRAVFLEHIAEAYHVFSAKLDDCIKPVIVVGEE